jgi:hypothetical protein
MSGWRMPKGRSTIYLPKESSSRRSQDGSNRQQPPANPEREPRSARIESQPGVYPENDGPHALRPLSKAEMGHRIQVGRPKNGRNDQEFIRIGHWTVGFPECERGDLLDGAPRSIPQAVRYGRIDDCPEGPIRVRHLRAEKNDISQKDRKMGALP